MKTHLFKTLEQTIYEMYEIATDITYYKKEGTLTAALAFLRDYKEMLDKQ